MLYEPLPGPQYIRLLTLQPGKSNEQIRCSLTVAPLQHDRSSPPFDAVSYVWGDDGPQNEIMVEGWPCLVRKNLWQFLLEWRDATAVKIVWIDALCINQNDLTERGRQVQLMGDLYRSAVRVLIWLGPSTVATDHAMEMLGTAKIVEVQLSLLAGEESSALTDWCENPYWSRIWIIQEVLLARTALLLYGSKTANARYVVAFFTLLRNARCSSRILESPAATLFEQAWDRSNTERSPAEQVDPDTTLSKLILANRQSKCLDKRDHVYALMSLASDCTKTHMIEVDYAAPLNLFFSQVLTFCQPSAEDVFPFAHALARILGLTPSSAASPPSQDTDSIVPPTVQRLPRTFHQKSIDFPILPVSFYQTGSVVACMPYIDFKTVKNCIDKWRSRFPYLFVNNELPNVVAQLETINPSTIRTGFAHLNSINARRKIASKRPCEPKSSPAMAHAAMIPALWLVVAYFPARKEITNKKFYPHHETTRSLGLAFGHVDEGDQVLQVLRHETAFIAGPSPRSPPPFTVNATLKGQAIFIHALKWPSWTDPSTGSELKYNFIKSIADFEAGCHQGECHPVHLNVTSNEILGLVARSP